MPSPIEDYALIGDCHTAALVSREGSIDWLCLPRFDSPSMFGALLGTQEQGCWSIRPTDAQATARRRYVEDTFVLETDWATSDGEIRVTDVMPHGDRRADVLRRIEGISGTVSVDIELRFRFGYADAIPWVRQLPDGSGIVAVAGPDAVVVRGVRLRATDHAHAARVEVAAGDVVDVSLTWYPSHREVPEAVDVGARVEHTVDWWRDWATHCDPPVEYEEAVVRSLLVLRALTHEDTGGIVAAATTSLPESFGGVRNWDYRYVWLRDASLTLEALMQHGFTEEAHDWRNWLLRAIAGDPNDLQIMYGLAGERHLVEEELDSLPGYLGAAPVRVGNGAYTQYQGDVFGSVMIALDEARSVGIPEDDFSWSLQRALLGVVEEHWNRPDRGIWEVRGDEQHFTHSRAMLWAALDRGVRAVRVHGLDGPADRWESLRDTIRDTIERENVDHERGCYVQHAGTTEVDASLLVLAQIGYVAADDPRMLATVAAIEEDLLQDGLLLRYRTTSGVDGLPGEEHPFLACSFWLVQQYAASGRVDDARRLMGRLLSFRNDVGLLSEEYDVQNARHVGNTPQALSHLSLVRAADAIANAQNSGNVSRPRR
ncbi:glycoside hydrolase family 15 protein [Plantibacter flavus]